VKDLGFHSTELVATRTEDKTLAMQPTSYLIVQPSVPLLQMQKNASRRVSSAGCAALTKRQVLLGACSFPISTHHSPRAKEEPLLLGLQMCQAVTKPGQARRGSGMNISRGQHHSIGLEVQPFHRPGYLNRVRREVQGERNTSVQQDRVYMFGEKVQWNPLVGGYRGIVPYLPGSAR
jgi:hypothetical protein